MQLYRLSFPMITSIAWVLIQYLKFNAAINDVNVMGVTNAIIN